MNALSQSTNQKILKINFLKYFGNNQDINQKEEILFI